MRFAFGWTTVKASRTGALKSAPVSNGVEKEVRGGTSSLSIQALRGLA